MPRGENDSHAQVEDRKTYDHQMCGICHLRHPLPCWYFENQLGELVVRPEFEHKVLGRMKSVNPDRTQQIPGDNASISRNTEPVSKVKQASPSATGIQAASTTQGLLAKHFAVEKYSLGFRECCQNNRC